ncbi:MAG: response regulator transcription factor [Rhodospirillales bacterium]|nr:response regulator transcription factor [Rhodospirillales bacterium]MDH3912706.1 response regulator transcription factor [Rhodospirillales bacterium]MDH3921053.1 response regulator transcription factor [Rhodospirillales bacterium]MDH3966186.1 response regulator transcription factor [Rhodospirillales bacterium]
MSAEPTVFVVDDDSGVRDTLRWLVESIGLKIETFASAQEFLNAYDPSRPGCLVTDVRMPGMSGIELQSKLAAEEVTLPIIVVSGYADVPTAVRSMKRGAIDFVEKPFDEQMMLERIQLSILEDARLRQERAARERTMARLESLTRRERQVMDLVILGKSNKEVARALDISPKTVEVHRSHVMVKMQAESLAELVRIAGSCTISKGNP